MELLAPIFEKEARVFYLEVYRQIYVASRLAGASIPKALEQVDDTIDGTSAPEAIDGANRPTSEKGDDTNNRHEPPSGA